MVLFILVMEKYHRKLDFIFKFRPIGKDSQYFTLFRNRAYHSKGLLRRVYYRLLTDPLLPSWPALRKVFLIAVSAVLIYLVIGFQGSLTVLTGPAD